MLLAVVGFDPIRFGNQRENDKKILFGAQLFTSKRIHLFRFCRILCIFVCCVCTLFQRIPSNSQLVEPKPNRISSI